MEILSGLGQPSSVSKLPFLAILVVTLTTILVGYFKFKLSHHLPAGKKLPPGSLGLPLIGELISFLKAQKNDKIVEWIAERIAKYGPVFKTALMTAKVVVITGQAGNRFVFSGGDNGIASNQPGSVGRIFGKHSIFETSGSRHKLVRGAMMTFLRAESLQRCAAKMDSLVKQQLFQELDGKDSIQVVTFMKRIAFRVSCSLLFGLPEGEDKDALFNDLTIALKGLWTIPLDFPGTIYRKAMQARGRICRLLLNLIRRKKKEMEEGKVGSHEDIISTFLELRDENGKPLPEVEIIDNLITLMIASHDTTTILLSLLIRQLARDPEVCSKVFEEQNVVKEKKGSDGMLGWSDLQMMKYTWRVFQELMRLTPPVFGNFKCTWRDTSYGGFHIPKGWQVLWVTSPTHMDENIFAEPEKFDPSRFENPTISIPPYAYIPFGAGPRICPGGEFTRMEALLIIHHLITNYQWTEMIPDEPLTRDPLPYPAMGLPIKLHPRKSMKGF